MARSTGTSGANYLSNAAPAAWTSAGTVFLLIRPNGWASGGGTTRVLFDARNTAATRSFGLYRVGANILAGWFNSGSEARVVVTDSGVFADGVWASHIITWDDPTNGQAYYVDGVQKGISLASFVTDTVNGFAIGSEAVSHTLIGAATYAEWGRWNRVLATAEYEHLHETGCPLSVPVGLVAYAPLVGGFSPEIELMGGEGLTLNGTVAKADHPAVRRPSHRRRVAVGTAEEPPPAGNPRLGDFNIGLAGVGPCGPMM